MGRSTFGSIRAKRGRWQARYKDEAGDDHYCMFDNKRDAVSFLARAKADMDRGDWINPVDGATTIAEWSKNWLSSKRQVRYRTRQGYEGAIRRHIVPRLGRIQLGKLTPEKVDAWLCELEDDGCGAATVDRAYRVLRAMMRDAVKRSYIRASPCDAVEPPTVAEREQLFLTAEQVADVAVAAGKKLTQACTMVLLAAYGGLRWGEVAGLGVQHVDALRRRVRVERQLHPNGTLDTPKTTAGTRWVDIPSWLVDELAATIAARRPAATLAPEHRDLVFLTSQGQRLHPSNFTRRVWKPAVKKALPDELAAARFHDLRHTAVALYLGAAEEAGRPVNAKRLQQRMGHSSVGMTWDRYGHLLPEDEDAAVTRWQTRSRRQAKRTT